MRPVLIGDLDLAARALLAAPRGDWDRLVQTWVASADRADRFRRHTGRALTGVGDGTLSSVVLRLPRAAPARTCDPDYLAALQTVLAILARPTFPA